MKKLLPLSLGFETLALLKSKMTKVFVWSVIPIVLLILSLQPERAQVQGTTFIVKSTADTVDNKPGDGICADSCGNCTLRAAIMEANAFPGDDTINFDPSVFNVPQTIRLSIPGVNEEFDATGDLDITSNLTITGVGANLTTIDGGGIDRVLDIRWENENRPTVSISGLTVTHGKTLNTSPGGGSGGGIKSQGTLLTLTNVTVDDNEADYGGGIWVGGPVTLNYSTVSNNTALAGGGGGIMNYIHGPLTLNNSTVSGNKGGFAGGIVTNSWASPIFLNNSTVSFNTGGLYNAAGTVTVKNTILADNGPSGNCAFHGGTLTSLGHNLSSDVWCEPARLVSGGLNQPTDLNNTPAQLAPLSLNLPGSTATHALCTGLAVPHPSCGAIPSPAIDKGGDCLAVDQRGVPRPQGAACDIGAYEVGAGPNGAACIPPPNMVAWWPLDRLNPSGEYDDLAGGDNNGTPLNNPSQIPNQYVGNSLQAVNGKSVRVTDAPNLNFALESFTINAWVKYTPGTPSQPIVYKLVDPTGRGSGYFLYLSRNRLYLQIESKIFPGPQFSLPIATWIFVAATVDKTNSSTGSVRLYVGVPGKPLGSSTSPAGAFNASSPGTTLLIGAGRSEGQIALGIDEVEIFNRALTDQPEIQSIFNAGSIGNCSIPQKKGMTWFHTASNATYGTITVGCGPDGPNRCDPAHGDTPCTQQLPVLCIYKPRPAFPLPVGLPVPNEYNRWSGGVVATTPPHAGNFKDTAEVNKFCTDVFGAGWRVAEFHDGLYWNFQAYGGTVSAPTVPSTRFWVYINDQKDGNCWQP